MAKLLLASLVVLMFLACSPVGCARSCTDTFAEKVNDMLASE